MCQAPIGKVVKVEGDKLTVVCKGELVTLQSRLKEAKGGDYVLFSSGIALDLIEKEEAMAVLGES